MYIKVVLGTILLVVGAFATGLANYMFPIINDLHVRLGGQPLADPRGDMHQQLTMWLDVLPADTTTRVMVIGGGLLGYLFLTSAITLALYRLKRRQLARKERELSRARMLRAYHS